MWVLHEIYLIHVRIVMGLVGTQNMGFGRRCHGLFNGLSTTVENLPKWQKCGRKIFTLFQVYNWKLKFRYLEPSLFKKEARTWELPFIFLTRRRVGLLSFYFAHHRSMSSKKKRGLLSRDDAKNSWEELCDRIYYSNTYSCVANDLRQLQSYCCCIVCIVYLYSSLYFKKKQD